MGKNTMTTSTVWYHGLCYGLSSFAPMAFARSVQMPAHRKGQITSGIMRTRLISRTPQKKMLETLGVCVPHLENCCLRSLQLHCSLYRWTNTHKLHNTPGVTELVSGGAAFIWFESLCSQAAPLYCLWSHGSLKTPHSLGSVPFHGLFSLLREFCPPPAHPPLCSWQSHSQFNTHLRMPSSRGQVHCSLFCGLCILLMSLILAPNRLFSF